MEKFWKEFLVLFVIYNLITILFLQAPLYALFYYTDDKNKQTGPSGSTGYFIGTVLALIVTYSLWGLYGHEYVNSTSNSTQ